MIHEVSGDILLTQAKAIAHGVAPSDHFNQGLAHALREQWPSMVKDFRHYCSAHHPKAGEIWSWAGAGGIRVINLLTQEPAKGDGGHPGKATLSAVRHALEALHKEIVHEKIPSLALPKLATGVGGLDWNEVKEIIVEKLGTLEIPIYLYSTFHPGQKAKEV